MRRVMAVCLIIWMAFTVASCFDPEPGEISVRTTRKGDRVGCGVLVYNSSGQQIQLTPTDMNGILFMTLPPGKYQLKFQDNGGNPYPAVRDVNLGAGESKVLTVELTEGPDDGSAASEPEHSGI